ncbi:MAG: ATP-binding cassette domain-containing protein [Chlorobi bacterium]|nr:ATP-binding cassette domain-containing protein [Chlorobiota bacterium]MCI0716419.1 ATP-binding cassette domain-containing protein [Chlorobiota bacterium]
MIEVKNLSKSYYKTVALKDVSLRLSTGCITAVMGPNDSGKTTLLKCILGLVKPLSGEIYVNGFQVNGNCEYRKFIGYMPQFCCFPENLKVKEVFNMLKDVRGNHCTYDEDLIGKLKIDKIFNSSIGSLSGGSRQRVSSSAAFLFNQEIIILDEPTAGLDPASSEIVKEKIIAEKQKGKLIIITSHIISEVEELADRIVYMLDGSIYFDSTKEELLNLTGEENLNKAIAKITAIRY